MQRSTMAAASPPPTRPIPPPSTQAPPRRRRLPLPSAAAALPLLLGLLLAASPLALPPALAQQAGGQAGQPDAVFRALDADGDGVISPQDWAADLDVVASALGIDDPAGLAALAAPAAAARERRDGLTGEVRQPKRSAFMPSSAGVPSRGGGSGAGEEPLSFTKGFTAGVAMIVATEIGDKTFFIAAVLSMRNDRRAVFLGAFLALIVMTILSTMMGLILPNLLPRKYTHIIGGLLFLYFGTKLVMDSRGMAEDQVSEELEEVEEELLMTRSKKDDSGAGGGGGASGAESGSDVEAGAATRRRTSNPAAAPTSGGGLASAMAVRSSTFQSTFMQSLTLTFLAEWGDRSQIATIALAAAKDPVGVTVGGCLGHCMCTGMAVAGGRMLASRISEKTVSFWGGCIFLVFGVHSLFFES